MTGRDPIKHPEDAGGVLPGRIAWFSIFASGLVEALCDPGVAPFIYYQF